MAVGCSESPIHFTPPRINTDAGRFAVQQYDNNGDGILSESELKASPALKSALERIDANGDGTVCAEEINARIDTWRRSSTAITQLAPVVRLNGQPLVDADVTIVPEIFLGSEVKAASGKTDARGVARLRISDHPGEVGVHLGFFSVKISKKVRNREMIPTRYNVQSELGIEIASDNRSMQALAYNISNQ